MSWFHGTALYSAVLEEQNEQRFTGAVEIYEE
jgi:hypothetical protein